jgi:hypothetical protein
VYLNVRDREPIGSGATLMWIRVVETNTVAKAHVAGWMLVSSNGAGVESTGHVEDQRHAARFTEASVSEPNTRRVHELRRRGVMTVLGH